MLLAGGVALSACAELQRNEGEARAARLLLGTDLVATQGAGLEEAEVVIADDGMAPAPGQFAAEATVAWDGARTLQGIWVAHPEAGRARRVRIENLETGRMVDGAMFRREPGLPGPEVMISSDAAVALGLRPERDAALRIVALVPAAEAPEPAEAAAEAAADAPEEAAGAAEEEPSEATAAAGEEQRVTPEMEAGRRADGARAQPPEAPPDAEASTAAEAAVEPVLSWGADADAPGGDPPGADPGPTADFDADDILSRMETGQARMETVPAEPQADASAPSATVEASEPAVEAAAAAPEAEPVPEPEPAAAEPAAEDPAAQDLSEAAAAEIAALARETEAALGGEGAAPPASPLDLPFVQAGIFAVSENANRLVRRIREAGLPAEGKPMSFRGKPATRVVAGPFMSRAERSEALRTIRRIGPSDAVPVRE